MKKAVLATITAGLAAAALYAGPAAAQYETDSGERHRNGVGPDPDGDTNPATNTRAMARIGDAAEAALDPPYQVITFETPPGKHGDKIGLQYAKDFGVTFGKGLSRQVCEGQRYFRYDSDCTYRRAPSGRYAALYQDEWRRPLEINFANPVCAAALAIYPTGGKEGEQYRVRIQPYTADGRKLARATVRFSWTQDTFRWRLMAGAFMLGERASRIEVNVDSIDDKKKNVRFLIDDVAFIESGCEETLTEIADAAASAQPPRPRREHRRSDDGESDDLDLTAG
ncbi:MAG: hypothetical protein VX640_16285 [Pseudomonadota bacterium]|nr:hypothetical protein [Pseudomonadota bacterium]